MTFNYRFSRQFLKDLKVIERGDPSRIVIINEIIERIVLDPFSNKLHFKKIRTNKNELLYRYEVGKKYRILVELIYKDNQILFMRVGRRENFY